MWMANYKCQCRKLLSLPSLWEFTELWAEPESLTFCSEYKMLIHAAGNPELGERAVVLSSSLPQPLRLQLPVSLPPPEVTACPPIMLVCVLSGCLTHLLFTCWLLLTWSTPLFPDRCLGQWTKTPWDLTVYIQENQHNLQNLSTKHTRICPECIGRGGPWVSGSGCQKSLKKILIGTKRKGKKREKHDMDICKPCYHPRGAYLLPWALPQAIETFCSLVV